MTYSTCSMNPLENEAVVAEVLRRCGDSVEVVDASDRLPSVQVKPHLRLSVSVPFEGRAL
jgi:multisite-specific tRNA:(cytosine-C5)-methyltransferase